MLFKSFRKAAKRLLHSAPEPCNMLSAGFNAGGDTVIFAMALVEKDGRFSLCTVNQQHGAERIEHLDKSVGLKAAMDFLDRFEMDCRSRALTQADIREGGAVNGPHAYFRDVARDLNMLVGHEAISRHHARKTKVAFAERRSAGARP